MACQIELNVFHPTGRQHLLIEGKAQQGNLVWFFFWLLGSLKWSRDLYPVRLFDNVV